MLVCYYWLRPIKFILSIIRLVNYGYNYQSYMIVRRGSDVLMYSHKQSIMIATICTSYSTDIHLMFNITWTCIVVCFIFKSYLLYLALFSCSISQHLIQQQRFLYIFLISSLLFPQEYLSYFSQFISIYNSRYNFIFLCFTN